MTVSVTGNSNISPSFRKVSSGDFDAESTIAPGWTQAWTSGTGANQMNQIWGDARTLAGGANEDLDLAGSLVDMFGATMTFTAVKYFAIKNTGTVTITVKPAASNGMATMIPGTLGVKIAAGGTLQINNPTADGYAVTAGTGDKINVTNDDGSVTAAYTIIVGGLG